MLQRKTVDTATLELLIDLQGINSFQGFLLGGDTALALKFGHRISVDLDLFTTQPFDTEEVISAIRHKFKDLSVLNMSRNSLSLSVQGVKVDVLSHQYSLLQPPELIEDVRSEYSRYCSHEAFRSSTAGK
ncbi:nucleotidyl transferase AbiEii/AbiGii toxin family protein [Roseivirga seohaensis]|uniref:nucleotidyl transferase AbiEii/AbiGii toxin family protein n=1 Tax=Roseivirga seohaensis TaxID=1914963 RepID=UPI000B2A25AA|nr:nucleotidyl transferase AbiEii/AbiGii toxin family protein [Roseivirga seohaensis]